MDYTEEIKKFLNEYKELKSEKELINYLETDNCNLILGNFVTKKIKSLLSLNKDDKTIMHMNG